MATHSRDRDEAFMCMLKGEENRNNGESVLFREYGGIAEPWGVMQARGGKTSTRQTLLLCLLSLCFVC